MKCAFDRTRIERCLVCKDKCYQFMEWYKTGKNAEKYESLADGYAEKYPEKYSTEVVMSSKKIQDAPEGKGGKSVAVISEDGFLTSIINVKMVKHEAYSNCRLLELTGKEYDIVKTVIVKSRSVGDIDVDDDASQEKEQKSSDTGKKVAVISSNGKLDEITNVSSLKKTLLPSSYSGCRLLELTGKEYYLVVSVSLAQKALASFDRQTKAAKQGKKR